MTDGSLQRYSAPLASYIQTLSRRDERMDHPPYSKTTYTGYRDRSVWVAVIGSLAFLAVAALRNGKR